MDNLVEVSRKMIKTFPKQGYTSVVFNATFYRNEKKLNAIEQAEVSAFSQLIRSYEKSESPDKVKASSTANLAAMSAGTLILCPVRALAFGIGRPRRG